MLAFEISVEPYGEDLRLAVTGARGCSLPAPATALAIAAMEALLGKEAARQGTLFTMERAAERIARALLPEAGARAPSTEAVTWTAIGVAHDVCIMHASGSGIAAETTPQAARAREANVITRAADEARREGDLDRARALDLLSLERAPRHPEICARLAEIDAFVGGRAEAALATLADADRSTAGDAPPHHALLRAELLAEVGDRRAAIAAFEGVGEHERVPFIAARAYERAAELADDATEALGWIDLAIARSPATVRLRWARVKSRLAVGRVEDAMADVEHLEAQAAGPHARHAVWWRAGAAWQRAGLVAEAAPLFERALRFVPDDHEALSGLGRALLAQGRTARGVALLTRAIEVGDRSMLAVDGVVLDLARALADKMADRPAAIARVRAIGIGRPEAAEARALEGRWRSELGDLAGASFAYARLRDRADRMAGDDPAHEPTAILLLEAATFERDTHKDPLAAQRHLAAALRLCPHDTTIGSAYRAVGVEIAGSGAVPAENTHVAAIGHPSPTAASFSADDFANMEGDSEAELRVEELSRRLQGDPTNDAVADELTELLLHLGRSHELLALLSARLEDAPPERRPRLVPKQRAVLVRLERDALAHGQEIEAQLFASARAALEPDPEEGKKEG